MADGFLTQFPVAYRTIDVDQLAADIALANSSATSAAAWASAAEDVPVVPGQFSALHWAAKSAAAYAGRRSITSFGALTATSVSTDMATLNAAKEWCESTGGTVYFPSGGSMVISEFDPPSFGCFEGRGFTMRVAGSAGFLLPTGKQLYHFTMEDGIRFVPHTVMDIGAYPIDFAGVPQLCRFRIEAVGFTSAYAYRIRTSTLVTFKFISWPIGSSNAIYNLFEVWGDDMGGAFDVSGHYGTTPTASPANSSPQPAGVVTKNTFVGRIWNHLDHLVRIRACADSDTWILDGYAGANDLHFVVYGNGNVDGYTGNNYVNSHRVHLVGAVDAAVTTVSPFRAESWTFGHHHDFEHDINFITKTVTMYSVGAGVAKFSYVHTGKMADTVLGNTATFTVSPEHWMRLASGLATRPTYSFVDDFTSGMYLDAAGRIAFSAGGARVAWMNSAGIGLIDGSASTPAVHFTGATTSGMYRSGTSVLFATDGVARGGFTDGGFNSVQPYFANGTQVMTTRRTGWTAATGTATRTSFATTTVTTAQLAERVKALIDDLITHGLIGA